MTTMSPLADDYDTTEEAAELPPIQDIINYNFYYPHRDHLKHQVHGDEDEHRREHLHFRAINLQHPTRRHSVRHRGSNTRDVTSERETPLTTTIQTDDVSITSDNELSLFPPIPDDEEQINTSLLFGTTIPEEIPIVSVHYNLPESESTAMETTV